MRPSSHTKHAAIIVLLVGLGLACARDAGAQGFINPFIGYNFGGDSGCAAITDCKDKNVNWGVAFGAVGPIVGIEGEWSYTSDFFGETSARTSNVTTFMGNFLLAPRFGPVQPYGLAGLGLIRTSVEATGTTAAASDKNDFGYDLGGGVMVFFSRHVGVRGDVRYFHSFQVLDLLGLNVSSDTKLDFGRISGGVVFKF